MENKKNDLNKKNEQDGTGEQGEPMTIEQAKAKVLKLVDAGLNYREIAKKTFNVNGAKRHFGLGAISGLVNKRDNPKKLNEEEVAQNAFKIFDTDQGPVFVVGKLAISPDKAKSLYDKYIDLKALDLSKPSTPLKLKKLDERVKKLEFSVYNELGILLTFAKGVRILECPDCKELGGVKLKMYCERCETEIIWPED